tara:strand:+ start:558 stop:764 length:207 start_codon:yes stop_codon:yes gene_type:complete
MNTPTRTDDDKILQALEMRRLGKAGPAVAKALGMSSRYWTALTNLVRNHDADHCKEQENRSVVMGAYW